MSVTAKPASAWAAPRERSRPRARTLGSRLVLYGLVAMVAVWFGRAAVPPAPLFVARATVARDVTMLEPLEPVSSPIPASSVATWGGLTAYTAVYAPAGLEQAISHRWWKDGRLIGIAPLSPVRGGRKEGFRTYSKKTDLKPPYQGRYHVDVVTAEDTVLNPVTPALVDFLKRNKQ